MLIFNQKSYVNIVNKHPLTTCERRHKLKSNVVQVSLKGALKGAFSGFLLYLYPIMMPDIYVQHGQNSKT